MKISEIPDELRWWEMDLHKDKSEEVVLSFGSKVCRCGAEGFTIKAITVNKLNAEMMVVCKACSTETLFTTDVPDLVERIGINSFQDMLRSLPRIQKDRRHVETEQNKVQIGQSPAMSSHEALFYHLIDPDTLERLAKRKTGGGKKYGSVQWRQGLNDVEYVTDRYNHFWQHLVNFQRDGNKFDDNIGGMLWALDALCAAERLCPDVLKQVIGTSHLFGETAIAYHQEEQKRRGK